jgi:microsomal dipeptidase-like Zn-dependent dipeptidase
MRCRVLKLVAAVLVVSSAAVLEAQGIASVQSCAEAQALLDEYAACQGTGSCSLPAPATARCWDFEDGTLQGWTAAGDAFTEQPTYGDNVKASRVMQSDAAQPGQGTTRFADLQAIGGDYWNGPYAIGHQGRFWIGTYERKPSEGTYAWGTTRGDGATGSLTSPSFVASRSTIDLLLGGYCGASNAAHVRVEEWRMVYDPLAGRFVWRWSQAYDGAGTVPLKITGWCREVMARRQWSVSHLSGRTLRIVIEDAATSSWGHINVDHVRHTDGGVDDEPDASVKNLNQPLWGFADLHAHVGQEVAFQAEGAGSGANGRVFWGRNGTAGNYSEDLPDCDGTGHGTNHQAGNQVIAALESASLGSVPTYWGGGGDVNFGGSDSTIYATHFHPGGGFDSAVTLPDGQGNGHPPNGKNLRGYPYWWSRGHQQMHIDWIKRAYRGGQRLMVAAAGNAEPLGAFMRDQYNGRYVSDYGAMRAFADHMKNLAAENSSWMEIALTPWDAHRIIRANKLAIVLATEVDDLGEKCGLDFPPGAIGTRTGDFNRTAHNWGNNPRNQKRNDADAVSCTAKEGWEQRIADLYEAGFRLLTPIHMADNALGGAAIYSDLQHPLQLFMRGAPFDISDTTALRTKVSRHLQEMAWCWNEFCGGGPLTWGFDTPTTLDWTENYSILPANTLTGELGCGGPFHTLFHSSNNPTCNDSNAGHRNSLDLLDRGETVLEEMIKRGMLIDVAHMSNRVRNEVLGTSGAGFVATSISNPGCNLDAPANGCEKNTYPMVSTHAGFRQLHYDATVATYDGKGDEGSLSAEEIARIRESGGVIGVGTAPADVRGVDLAFPGSDPYTGVRAATVENSCGGSTTAFAQSYIYALRHMNTTPSAASGATNIAGGVALGTDFNGLEARLNPRYGTDACYARGNMPWAYVTSWDGKPMVNVATPVPVKYNRRLIYQDRNNTGEGNAMGGTASKQAQNQLDDFMLRYTFHGAATSVPTVYMSLPPNYLENVYDRNWGAINHPGMVLPAAAPIDQSGWIPPLVAQTTGNRTFDYNKQGLAQYGMLPDMFQDARTVGLTKEQLGPAFHSANAFVKAWVKACKVASERNPGFDNSLGCAKPTGY